MSTVVSLICLGPSFQKMTHHFLLHGSLRPTCLEKSLKPFLRYCGSFVVGLTILDGHVYAIGGWDGNCRLDSVERYDPGTNSWAFIPPMKMALTSPAVATLKGFLYVTGKKTHSTFCILFPSADNLCIQFGSRSGPMKCRA